jgi:tRNA(Ile)-lysidine synthase
MNRLTNRPIEAEEARSLLRPIKTYRHVVLAVSGGADSLAMMFIVAGWAKELGQQGPQISVATVDHGLRPEASQEAASVSVMAQELALAHRVLVWTGEKPSTGLQEAAREARYRLLKAYAEDIGADAIVLAHHAEDQAETVLIRLSAGSGLSGLAGMASEAWWDGMILLRPFLAVSGDRLRATVEAAGWKPIEDPSNRNERFTRVRVRKARDVLAAEGLDAVRLGRLSMRMRRADHALQTAVIFAHDSYVLPTLEGIRFAFGLFNEPDEIVLRVIGQSISTLKDGTPPELLALERIVEVLLHARHQGKSLRRTLGGVVLSLDKEGTLSLTPEGPRGSYFNR